MNRGFGAGGYLIAEDVVGLPGEGVVRLPGGSWAGKPGGNWAGEGAGAGKRWDKGSVKREA